MPGQAGPPGHKLISKPWRRSSKRFLTGMGNLPYDERFKRLGITSLQSRRERGGMVETYKILNGMVDVDPNSGDEGGVQPVPELHGVTRILQERNQSRKQEGTSFQ